MKRELKLLHKAALLKFKCYQSMGTFGAICRVHVLWLQAVSKLYLDTSTLLWNGNEYKGQNDIGVFFDKLPASKHSVDNITAQPLTCKTFSI